MNEKMIAKEELLSMLSEIADQLEDLENILETNLANARHKVRNDYAAKIENCGEKLTGLEMKTANFPDTDDKASSHSSLSSKKSMMLELGF